MAKEQCNLHLQVGGEEKGQMSNPIKVAELFCFTNFGILFRRNCLHVLDALQLLSQAMVASNGKHEGLEWHRWLFAEY